MDEPRQHPTTPPLTEEELTEVEFSVECGSPISRSIAFRLLPEFRRLRKALKNTESKEQKSHEPAPAALGSNVIRFAPVGPVILSTAQRDDVLRELVEVIALRNSLAEARAGLVYLENKLAEIRRLATPFLKTIEE